MTEDKLKNIIEAALMVASRPLSVGKLLALFSPEQGPVPSRDEIHTALQALSANYEQRGVELKQVASGWRFQSRSDYAPWLNRLWDERPPRYSRALLATLAIIAYRQPITRGEIEDIRGVSVSTNIIRTLSEREWIRAAGQRDVPGRPTVYATTREFLDYFNLKSLSELPSLAELRDIDTINPDLFSIQVQQEPALDTDMPAPVDTASQPVHIDQNSYGVDQDSAGDEQDSAGDDEQGQIA